MAASKKLIQFLKTQKIKHKVLKHKRAYTAQEVAASQHVPGKQLVKAVVVKTGRPSGRASPASTSESEAEPKAGTGYILVVLPAIHLIDFKKLKALTKAKTPKLATEAEIKKLTKDFAVGALPPFGSLVNLETYMDSSLEEDKEIVFNAGTHTETVKIKMADYLKAAKPAKGDFGKHV